MDVAILSKTNKHTPSQSGYFFQLCEDRWTSLYPQEEWAKFGYRSEKKVEIFLNATMFLGMYCLNMMTSGFFLS
jgi:hypothetical protein